MTRLQWTKEEIVKKAAFAKYRTLARPTDRAFSIDELIFYDNFSYYLLHYEGFHSWMETTISGQYFFPSNGSPEVLGDREDNGLI
jgi:hypothetical protein